VAFWHPVRVETTALLAPMSLPTLFLVGVTHRTAPFGFREKLALSAELEATLAADLGRLRSVREFAILNTCNRVEIYGVATDVIPEIRAA